MTIFTRNGDDKDAIETAIKVVDAATQVFANRRMDQSIHTALSGKSVEEL